MALTLLAVALATTASAASEGGSRRVRIRWEAYRLGPSFIDPRDAGAPVNFLTVLQDVAVTGAPILLREPELAEDRLVVRGFDANGSPRFQTVIADPRVLRAESGEPEGRVTGRVLHRPLAVFDVVLPREPPIAELRFYHPLWTGEGWQLQDLGKPLGLAALGAPPPLESLPPPPPSEPKATWPVTTIIDNGDPARRLDLVILGDGYTSAEMPKYVNEVRQLVKALFAQEPFAEYQSYFNVHRVDVASAQSGADHPEWGKLVDTALDAFFDCTGVHRVVCVDQPKVNKIVGDSLPQVPPDQVLVLVNDPEYGGSGGTIAVATTHCKSVEIVLHESGHSLGLLADEYFGSPPPDCVDDKEPSEPNATREARHAGAKWNLWLDTPAGARAACDTPSIPTLCKGAKYCDSTLYRPTPNSKMRTLGLPFDPINTEQLVKRIYSRVSPIDSVSPSSETVTLKPGQKQVFTVTTPRPSTHSLKVAWTVDGEPGSTDEKFTFVAPSTPGSHTVTVSVEDPTPKVRNDPKGLLKKSRCWTVTVTP